MSQSKSPIRGVIGAEGPPLFLICSAMWLALFLAVPVVCFAQEKTEENIALIERELTGHNFPEQSLDARLEAIETQIYGKAKHGSLEKRVEAIVNLLGVHDAAKPAIPVQSQHSVPAAPVRQEESSLLSPTEKGSVSVSAPTKARLELLPASSRVEAGSLPLSESNQTEEHKAAPAPNVSAPKAIAKTPVSPAVPGKNVQVKPVLKALTAKMAMPPTAPPLVPAKERPLTGVPTAPSRIPAPGDRTVKSPAAARLATQAEIHQLLQRGVKLHAHGQTAQAETIFRNVLSLDPHNVDAFYNLGSIAEGRHDYVTALTNYRAALVFNREDKELKSAIAAVEEQLARRAGLPAGSAQETVKEPGPFKADLPVLGSQTTSGDQKLFQLQSTQSAMLGTASSSDPPVARVTQPTPPTVNSHGRIGAILSVGAGFALRGSPLHCPVCGLLRGL